MRIVLLLKFDLSLSLSPLCSYISLPSKYKYISGDLKKIIDI